MENTKIIHIQTETLCVKNWHVREELFYDCAQLRNIGCRGCKSRTIQAEVKPHSNNTKGRGATVCCEDNRPAGYRLTQYVFLLASFSKLCGLFVTPEKYRNYSVTQMWLEVYWIQVGISGTVRSPSTISGNGPLLPPIRRWTFPGLFYWNSSYLLHV